MSALFHTDRILQKPHWPYNTDFVSEWFPLVCPIIVWFGTKANEMDINLAQKLTLLFEPFTLRGIKPSLNIEARFCALQRRSRRRPPLEHSETERQGTWYHFVQRPISTSPKDPPTLSKFWAKGAKKISNLRVLRFRPCKISATQWPPRYVFIDKTTFV